MDPVILAMFGMLIDIDLLKKVTSPNQKTGSKIVPQRLPSSKSIKTSDLIWVKCGMLMQNDMTIMVMRSKLKLENMTDLKRKFPRWLYWCVSQGCYSNVRACIFSGVALTA